MALRHNVCIIQGLNNRSYLIHELYSQIVRDQPRFKLLKYFLNVLHNNVYIIATLTMYAKYTFIGCYCNVLYV